MLGGGFTPWVMRQDTVEASNCMGSDASLMAHQPDGRLELTDYIRTASQVCLVVILYMDDTLCEQGKFSFITANLFSTGIRHVVAVTEILWLI